MFLVGLLLAVYFSVSSPGEHRDRTMLFWKSLPISDGMSIAAKVLIAMLVVPLILYAAAAVTQLMILLISTTVMAVKGDSLSAYFQRLELWELTKDFAYWLLASSLWYAPLFAFLMAISTFAKRAVAVWAVAPFLIGYAMDWFSDSNRFIEFVTHRAFGSLMTAFTPQADGAKDGLGLVPDPAKFFSTPDVWWGLLVAALLIAAAVRIRKRRASE
jgi:ABC-2 type transport system permease protein